MGLNPDEGRGGRVRKGENLRGMQELEESLEESEEGGIGETSSDAWRDDTGLRRSILSI